MARPENILRAQLDGEARRLLREHTDVDTCLRELHAITTDPVILGRASGTALGAWQATRSHDSDKVSRMLDAAGADPDVRDQAAAATVRRLNDRANGIGNP